MNEDSQTGEGPDQHRSVHSWPALLVLCAIAVLGAVLPLHRRPPATLIQHWIGLDAVPWDVQSVVCGVLGVGVVLLASRRSTLWWTVLAVAVAVWLLRGTAPLLFVASYLIAVRYRKLPLLAGYVVAAGLLLVVPYLVFVPVSRWAEDGQGWLANIALFVVAPVLIGQWVFARGQVLAGLRARAEQTEREQRMRLAKARAEERAKIAEDMHDVVAHRVSLMVLYAGVVEVHTAEDKARETAELIRTTGREALVQLRQLLGVLHQSEDAPMLTPQPTIADLGGLLDQSRAAGLAVRQITEGEQFTIPVAVQHAAYRVVREALTNVHKHAGLASTTVTLRYQPGKFEIAVRNAASAQDGARLPGSGSGLLALRQRVGLLGGDFVARPSLDGGFEVIAQLPVTQSD